ncbi:hypothetical protein EJF18_80159 [Clavispora lusitaniae]|uniref:Uncharacterized protein n=1 Tax=Clavispora lusitaniae TaxID=36911 RepID=A0ACD0WT04_CLALS|nr:hypothetical protein EJF14_80159 [Clavispora lusitaniae]QFZ36102.1 hypothetical protein EJF16_80159 [Clavispora lusitaniae]QFZ41786.1 hypothetical protein EJF15_80159 [Clavispora lusitaniae]QFZ47462.1 hypothetical protein EJF18_80159 [Clavispora lusitaniae]QFZ53141.1 hypothetical protein EJF17_80159 [Clavispora lusitaniae]
MYKLFFDGVVTLSAESEYLVVGSERFCWVRVHQVQFGGAENVFCWIHKHVHFIVQLVASQPTHFPSDVLLMVTSNKHRTFGLQEALQRLIPVDLVSGLEAGVEKEEDVQVWVKWEQVAHVVDLMEVLGVVVEGDLLVVSRDHRSAVRPVAGGERFRLRVKVRVGSDEVDLELGLWEKITKSFPHISGKHGFHLGADNENTHCPVFEGHFRVLFPAGRVQRILQGRQRAQTFDGERPLRFQAVRAEPVKKRRDGDRVRQDFGGCGQVELCVHWVEVPGVEERVPRGHAGGEVVLQRTREHKLVELTARPQVVLVEIDFSQRLVLLFGVVLCVVFPRLFVVVGGDPRVRTHKLHRLIRHGALGSGADVCCTGSDIFVRRLVPFVEMALGVAFLRRVQQKQFLEERDVSFSHSPRGANHANKGHDGF